MHRHIMILSLVIIIIVSLLGACSRSTPTVVIPTIPGTVAEYVDSLMPYLDPETTSPERYAVLEKAKRTGTVTEADWKELHELEGRCFQEKTGYPTTVIFDGIRAYLQSIRGTALPTEEEDEEARLASLECYEKYASAVDNVYGYLYGGPMNRDVELAPRAIYACLKDEKLVPESVTWEEYAADFFSDSDDKIYGPDVDPGIKECWMSAIKSVGG